MKPIYKSIVLANMALAVTLSLQAKVVSGEDVSTQAVSAESLQGLKVTLVSPNVSGAKDLIASGECVLNGAQLAVSLNGAQLAQGTHRIVVSAEYGTQTVVIYSLDITVPYYATLTSGTQEYADNVVVTETFGDGDKSGADASVYAKDGDGNAHITKPLSVGNANGEGVSIQASGAGAIASGSADATNGNVEASGEASCAFGIGTQATQDGQMVVGKCNVVDEDDSFAFIVGNGTDDEHRNNAFAVTKSGELALFEADGTPVILDAATLKALIASVANA